MGDHGDLTVRPGLYLDTAVDVYSDGRHRSHHGPSGVLRLDDDPRGGRHRAGPDEGQRQDH